MRSAARTLAETCPVDCSLVGRKLAGQSCVECTLGSALAVGTAADHMQVDFVDHKAASSAAQTFAGSAGHIVADHTFAGRTVAGLAFAGCSLVGQTAAGCRFAAPPGADPCLESTVGCNHPTAVVVLQLVRVQRWRCTRLARTDCNLPVTAFGCHYLGGHKGLCTKLAQLEGHNLCINNRLAHALRQKAPRQSRKALQ